MTRMTGGQAVAAALKAEGIEHVFGIVGTHNTPLYDGTYQDPALTMVTVRHEQGASLMAAGYARASGKVAGCFVVPGPGLTNALTGMGMAYSESAPMLVFGGQNALAQLEREGAHFHELNDSLNVAGSVCGYTARVSTPADVPVVVREAMRMMRSQRPRPAYIEMPLDVQTGEAEVMLHLETVNPSGPVPPELIQGLDDREARQTHAIFGGAVLSQSGLSFHQFGQVVDM